MPLFIFRERRGDTEKSQETLTADKNQQMAISNWPGNPKILPLITQIALIYADRKSKPTTEPRSHGENRAIAASSVATSEETNDQPGFQSALTCPGIAEDPRASAVEFLW
jgi:hypothetical protein